MKKTEKIEVRVSFEEKERLSELAEQRNQNISELIRDRMAGNYTIPAQSLSRNILWNRGLAITGLVLGAIALLLSVFLWPLLGLAGNDGTADSPPMATVQMTLPYNVNPILETKLVYRDGFTQSYTVPTEGAVYRTTHKVEESASVFNLTIDLCRVEGEICQPLESQRVVLSPPWPSTSSSQARLFDGDTLLFNVSTRPLP